MNPNTDFKSIKRTQSLLDFFLSPSVDQKTKQQLYAQIDVKLFAELSNIYKDGVFVSLEYLRQHHEFPYDIKEQPLSIGEIQTLLPEEVDYRIKKRIASRVLEEASTYATRPLEDLVKSISKSLDYTKVGTAKEFDAQAYYNYRKTRPKGFISGIKAIDKIIDGFEYGTVTTIAAYTGHYKTSIMLNLAYNGACLGYNSVIFSYEVPRELLYFRFLSRHSYSPKFSPALPINFVDIYKSHLTPEQEERLFNVVEPDFKNLPGKIKILEQNDLPDYTASIMKSYLDSFPYFVDAVFCDYIQLLAQSKMMGNKDWKEVGNYYVGQFRLLSVGDEGTRRIVFLLAQTNREGLKRAEAAGGKYDLRAISDLKQLENDSSYVIYTYQDDSLRASGEIKTGIMKGRFCEPTETPVVTRCDARYCLIGDDIEGYSDPVTTEEASSMFGSVFE